MLLPDLNSLQRRAETMIRAGFHLDKNDDPPVQNDQINLSGRTSIVSLNQRIPFPPKKLLRDPFSILA
jgi:hypothetical protein